MGVEDEYESNDEYRVNEMRKSSKYFGRIPLIFAACGGHLDIVKYLVENGARVNSKDGFGSALISAVKAGHLDIVKCLVENGASVNWTDWFGRSALNRAAEAGNFDIVKYLVENGANVNWQDEFGRSLLISAAKGGRLDIVKSLVEHGARINSEDKYGRRALISAAERGHLDIVKYLVENGARVNGHGRSALISAAEAGHLDIVKYLVKNGASVNAENKFRLTVLELAARAGHVDIVKYLLENGASVNPNKSKLILDVLIENIGVEDAMRKIVYASSRIKSLEKDLSDSNKQNDSLKAKCAEKDEFIKAQQEEINKLRGCCVELKKEASMEIEGNVQRKMQGGKARKSIDENNSNSVEEDKSSSQSARSEAADAGSQIDKGDLILDVRMKNCGKVNAISKCQLELDVRVKSGRKVDVKPKFTKSVLLEAGETGQVDVVKYLVQNAAKCEFILDVLVKRCGKVNLITKVIPREIVGFDNPFNCASSCGCGVVFFNLHQMGLIYCTWQLIRNMQLSVNTKVEDCIWSLKYFVELGVLEKKAILFREITETYTIERALNDARKIIKRPAVLALQYEDEESVGHCVAIMAYNGCVIDVQKKRYWKPEPNKHISCIHVISMTENAVDNWLNNCGLHACVGLDSI